MEIVLPAVALLAATARMSTPLLYAAMGGVLSERSGVMNIALEGFMLLGAFAAAMTAYYFNNSLLAVVGGGVAGGLGGAVLAFWCVTLRGNPIVAGTAINILGVGLPSFLLQQVWGVAGRSPLVPNLPSFVGSLNLLVFAALVLPVILHYVLFFTRIGFRIIAIGEHPRAAQTAGIDVDRYRWMCVLASGILAGVGGAQLSVGELSMFVTAMTAGRGFIALAAVILGNWNPIGVGLGCVFFGGIQAVQLYTQALASWIPQDLILVLPYIVTLMAVAGIGSRSLPPAGLGKHPETD